MKKILTYALLALALIHIVGFYTLSESGVNRFLDRVKSLTNAGDAKGLCDQLADDMKLNIIDHTAELDRRLGDGKINGGKTELCTLFEQTVPMMAAGGMKVDTERQDMKVKREILLHPWTAEVAFTEKQSTTIQAGQRSMTLKTESDDKYVLVMTFGGVKVKKLESEQWLQ